MQLSLLNNLRFEDVPQPDWEGTSQYTALMFDVAQDVNGNSIEAGRVYDGLFFNTTARHGAYRSSFGVLSVHYGA